ncbi:HPr kinase/phosphorylase [Spirochaetota bacterium]|nr:HPr kinase/phosphorylase [Spirochaetota bacterium]
MTPLPYKEEQAVVSVSDMIAYVEAEANLELRLITKNHVLTRSLNHHAVNRPGMNLFGFFRYFAHDRIQVFGRGEHKYLDELCQKKELTHLKKFLSYPIPFIIFSHNNTPHKSFIDLAEQHQIPIAVSSFPTLKLVHSIHNFFDDSIIVKEVHHGVMMEIYGSGVLLQGATSIGKSECALELLERGHRFVADDVVNIKRIKGNTLVGYPSPMLATHMEFNGIGIINVAHLFGVKSILREKEIELVICIEKYDSAREYDLIGLEHKTHTILDVELPMIVIPAKVMSNIPILIETATINERLKKTGYNTAKEFNKRIMKHITGTNNSYVE